MTPHTCDDSPCRLVPPAMLGAVLHSPGTYGLGDETILSRPRCYSRIHFGGRDNRVDPGLLNDFVCPCP